MQLTSQSIEPGQPIRPEYAMGVPGDDGPVPGPNRSPHLAWHDVPEGVRSFAVVCHDPDAPSVGDDVNQTDRTVSYDLPRVDFFHWVLVDVPPETRELGLAADSDGVTAGGKAPGRTPLGLRGVNSYTGWFAADAEMAGDYGGYDGPWPPFNDERVHRYVFTVYALDVPTLGLAGAFTGPDALAAMAGHVLAQAEISATYSLNPDARP